MKTKQVSLLVLFAFMLCGTAATASDTYKIGCAFAITGSASWLGEPQMRTVTMIEEEINNAGGINGKKLELFIEDTQGSNTRAVNAVKKLIKKNRVCAIIGPSRSGTSMAAIPVAEKEKIPLLSCAAAESMLQPASERKWIFKMGQNDSDAIRQIYDHLNQAGIGKVGVITGTTGFGAAGRTLLKAMALEYKIAIVADETYAPSDTDMTAQLVRMRNADARAIINWSIVPAQSIVPQNLKQLKMDIPLYQSHGFGNIKYVQAAGEAAEGILFPGSRLLAVDSIDKNHPQYPVLLKYKTEYETRFKDTVSTFGGHAYDALHMIINALRKVGDDPAAIRDYLETSSFLGTGGMFAFSPQDHCGLDKTAFEMQTVKNGKFVVLGK